MSVLRCPTRLGLRNVYKCASMKAALWQWCACISTTCEQTSISTVFDIEEPPTPVLTTQRDAAPSFFHPSSPDALSLVLYRAKASPTSPCTYDRCALANPSLVMERRRSFRAGSSQHHGDAILRGRGLLHRCWRRMLGRLPWLAGTSLRGDLGLHANSAEHCDRGLPRRDHWGSRRRRRNRFP